MKSLRGEFKLLIREVSVEDADEFIKLIKKVENESNFMLMESGERKTTAELQRKQLESIKQQDNSIIFVAEIEDKLVGYLFAIGGSVSRTKHSAYIVIGILQKFRGEKIGTALFNNVIEWASNQKLSRLELTVVTENTAGLALYTKSGFEMEGTKRKSILIDGRYYDEFYMSKLF